MPKPPIIRTARDGIQTAVAHRLCPHKGETPDISGNWICITEEFSMKHGLIAGMFVFAFSHKKSWMHKETS